MSDIQAEFSLLKQTTDPAVADAILRLIESGEDHELNRINPLDFSKRTGLDEERVISGFLHAARLGLFELSWNVLCPGCGGVLGAHSTLKSLRPDDYHCALCSCGYEASVDEQVEVAFTVSPRIRRIAAHDPNTLPPWEYYKQVFWSSGIDVDKEGFEKLAEEGTLEMLELPAGDKAVLSLQLPSQFIIVFEPGMRRNSSMCRASRRRNASSLRWSTTRRRRRPVELERCARDRCGCRSTIRPTYGCCRRYLLPATRCIS